MDSKWAAALTSRSPRLPVSDLVQQLDEATLDEHGQRATSADVCMEHEGPGSQNHLLECCDPLPLGRIRAMQVLSVS